MSSFTMLTRDAIQRLGATATFENGLLKISGNVGLSNYPIFDDDHREVLNSKILRRYWMEEIGVETAELWRFNIETHMMEMMPYYNELYKSTLIEFDPLKTIDVKNTGQSESTRSATSESDTDSDSTSGSKGRAVNSRFPQAQLRRNADYASEGSDSMTDSSTVQHSDATTVSNENDANENESSTSGYNGIPSDLIIAFRESIINIDTTVVDSLEENFMQIYSNGSSFSDSSSYGRYTI